MNELPVRRSVRMTALLLFVAANFWIAVFLFILLVTPHYDRVFRDRGLRVSGATQWALAVGHWTETYWYVVPLFGVIILPVMILLSWFLRHRVRTMVPSCIWFGLLLGLPWLLFLGFGLSVLLA